MWETFIPEMEGFLYPRVESTGKHSSLHFAEFGAYGRPDTMLSPRNGWPPPTGVP